MSMRGRGAPPSKPLHVKATIARLAGVMRPDAGRLGLVVLMAVGAVGLTVAAPKILGAATDVVFAGAVGRMTPAGVSRDQLIAGLRASGQQQQADLLSGMSFVPGQGLDTGRLSAILLGVLALYVVAFVLNWLQARLIAASVQRAMYTLRRSVQDKLSRLPMAHFHDHPRGEVLSRVTNDIDNLAQTLNQTLTQIVVSVLTVVGVLVMMISISPTLAVVAVVSIPISAVITVLVARRSQPQFVAQWNRTGALNAHIEEMFTGHEVVTAFGGQAEARARFDATNTELYEASRRAQFISGLIMPLMMFVSNLVYVAVAVVGAIQVASGLITIGSVQAFVQYARQFSQPLGQLGGMLNLLQSGLASAERVFELLDAPEQSPDPVEPARLPVARGLVAFEDVSFRYRPDTPLIDHLDLRAEPGRTVAIVGPTGAGKTTLVNLLLRFYELDGGRITIDGVDIAAMTRDELRGHFGMVLQDPWLFGGTIRENLAYGRSDATEDEIVAVARATSVDHLVRSLPDGYDTVLSDEGSALSAGQKQLVTIARAQLADPEILILDEATSSVDTRTEVLIQQAMNRLRAGRTSFVIAHRLSTIREADVIVVLEDGRVVEQGDHESLLAARGHYYDLYNAQFAAPAIEEEVSR
ncbi:ABC transporter ATP-binding protein [Tersicoccus sp. Bi-70]|uniref:ABC transporter ATP-binding protein n=1 Tax=Tersicoccus sp. Bi-70 TaxID=1897634 RepID=UPI00097B7716|nr:multidrug ABC transporter ATP-binding protein [Tersicoccus sp. Bi-70]